MKTIVWVTVAATLFLGSTESNAESAKDMLEAAWDAQVERWEGLDSYLVEQSVMGQVSKQYFLRTLVTESDGNERTMFLPAPDAGLEPGCVSPESLTAAAEFKGNDSAEHMSWFINNAELVGEDSIDGKTVLQFRADGLQQSQSVANEEVTMNSMSMWLSKGDYLPLKMRMEGTATVQGTSRPVVIDALSSDFRTVADTQLREPFRRVVNISGMMGGADMGQIAAAQEQMAEFENQMASMPAAQREMMEQMMGPQLETLRKLAETGGIETEIVVNSITANPEVFGERVKVCSGPH